MSELYNSLSHSKWDCKYPIIFVPKMRKKETARGHSSPFGATLPCQKDCRIVKGHLMHDHVHMLLGNTAKVQSQ